MKRSAVTNKFGETQKSRPHYSNWSIAWQSEFTMAVTLQHLDTKPFTDGADKAQIFEMSKQAWIKGFTTNPSLMKAAASLTTSRMPESLLQLRRFPALAPHRYPGLASAGVPTSRPQTEETSTKFGALQGPRIWSRFLRINWPLFTSANACNAEPLNLQGKKPLHITP